MNFHAAWPKKYRRKFLEPSARTRNLRPFASMGIKLVSVILNDTSLRDRNGRDCCCRCSAMLRANYGARSETFQSFAWRV